ncbi:hypothetical protein [Piscibacillus salipiscarius]|uniref:Uncharacterized protein n=1 Tax=Piscibacillus salipiscarius TaxID=299480 RepID=A0ABW5QBM0_9BACI|nr:hypothetical protein [Piscibacillus salipiscarius]
MGLFSKLFGNEKQEEKKPDCTGRLFVLMVYKEHIGDSDEEINAWIESGDGEWVMDYKSVDQMGPTGLDDAKRDRVPVPISYEYPIYFVYDSHDEGFHNPLFYSAKEDEVAKFIEEYEASYEIE